MEKPHIHFSIYHGEVGETHFTNHDDRERFISYVLKGQYNTELAPYKSWPRNTWFQHRRAHLLHGEAESLHHPGDTL